jgi:hypothetical protein
VAIYYKITYHQYVNRSNNITRSLGGQFLGESQLDKVSFLADIYMKYNNLKELNIRIERRKKLDTEYKDFDLKTVEVIY